MKFFATHTYISKEIDPKVLSQKIFSSFAEALEWAKAECKAEQETMFAESKIETLVIEDDNDIILRADSEYGVDNYDWWHIYFIAE